MSDAVQCPTCGTKCTLNSDRGYDGWVDSYTPVKDNTLIRELATRLLGVCQMAAMPCAYLDESEALATRVLKRG